jgi:hypothetical protein
MRDQFIPKALAIVIDRLTVGPTGFGRLPPVPMRGGSREAFPRSAGNGCSESWRASWRRVSEGQSWHRYIVGHPENAVRNISLHGSGGRGDSVGGQ